MKSKLRGQTSKMSNGYPIPPLREFPPGRLSERTRHLLAETAEKRPARFHLHAFGPRRPRIAALAAAAFCLAVGFIGLMAVAGGSTGSHVAAPSLRTSPVTLPPFSEPRGASEPHYFTNFGRSPSCLSHRALQLPAGAATSSLVPAVEDLFRALFCQRVTREQRASDGR